MLVCYMCVLVCMCVNVWLGVLYINMYMIMRVWVCYVLVLIFLSLCVYDCAVQQYRPIWWDLDPLKEIRICTRYGSDTLAIQRLTHEIIWRTISVRALKTRWRFRFKIASFYVSVCSCAIFLFTVVTRYLCFIRIISFARLIYFTSMISCIISCDVCECSLYLYSWFKRLSKSFYVMVGCYHLFGTNWGIPYTVTWFDLLIS